MSTSPLVSAPAPDRSAPTTAQDRSPWLRTLLYCGVAVTAVSAVAMVLLLVSYFIKVDPWPVFFWFGLYGLPLGFVLMLAYVISAAIARRRS